MTTEIQPAEAAVPSRRSIVGYHPGFSVSAVLVLSGVFILSWAQLAAPPNDGSNIPGALMPLCLLATVFCLLGTCRVVVDPAGHVELINLVVTRRVPVSELVAVEHHDGLHLRVVSGRRFGSFAFGSSLIGYVLRYPRSVRAARRIEAAVAGLRAGERLPEWRPDSVSTHLRARAFVGAAAVSAVLVLGTVVLNVLQTAALQ